MNLLKTKTICAAVLLASGLMASATLTMRLTSGATIVLIPDQSALDDNSQVGVVAYNGPVGPIWFFNAESVASKPVLGDAANPHIDLNVLSITTDGAFGSSTLLIEVTDTDFTANNTGTVAIGGTTDGTVTATTWADAGNVPFALTTQLSGQGPFGPPAFNSDAALNVGVGTPYSLTIVASITHPGPGIPDQQAITGFDIDLSINSTPPPPPPFRRGDTATIGFWHNKNGQALIKSLPNSPALGNWLAGNFPCLYGGLAGKSNNDVANLFLQYFNVKGQKTHAQTLGVALATYVTDSDLAGNVAGNYGFNVSSSGTGAKLYNVGSLGTTLGLQNNSSYTVFQLLQAANANCPFSPAVFNALNVIFSDINETGDR